MNCEMDTGQLYKKKNKLVLKDYIGTAFEKSLDGVRQDPKIPMLPLIHKADIYRYPEKGEPSAGDIFERGAIVPVPCDVFGEDLIYTYVGRPAYRELQRPVCFVLRPAAELLQNLFIFDTGAYYENLYGRIVDNILDVNVFRIPANADCIRRFITLHFGDNERYFRGDTLRDDSYEIMDDLEEFDYAVLLRLFKFEHLSFDTRCRTLENIIRTPVALDKYMQAVILPESMREDRQFRGYCNCSDSDFDIMFYDDELGSASAEICNQRLSGVLYEYYKEKGYINDGLR